MGNLSEYIQLVAHSSIFKAIIMVAILLNTVTFAISSSLKPAVDTMIYIYILDGIDCVFLALYCLEFVIKLYSFGRTYWFNGFNCFDFAVLICSLCQMVLSQTSARNWGVIKVMRSLRALRPLRSISLIGGLQVVVTALIATLTGSFIHIILLLTVLMFVYGIMGYYVYGYQPKSNAEDNYWGTFEKSFLSLFIIVTAEGWTDVAISLTSIHKNFGAYAFLISFLFIGHFIFGNLFVAVVIEQIDRATVGYEKRMDVKKSTVILKKKQKARHVQEHEIKSLLDQMKSGDFKSFPQAVLESYKHVRRDEFITLASVKENMLWVESVCQEYCRVSNYTHRIRFVHREIVRSLGELLQNMDSSALVMIEERNALEKQLQEHRERTSSVNFLRRLSRNVSFFGPRKIADVHARIDGPRKVSDGTRKVSDKHAKVHELSSQKNCCFSCLGILKECRCTNPEVEQLDMLDEVHPREERNYSQSTNAWLGIAGPSKSQRHSMISNRTDITSDESKELSKRTVNKSFRTSWS